MWRTFLGDLIVPREMPLLRKKCLFIFYFIYCFYFSGMELHPSRRWDAGTRPSPLSCQEMLPLLVSRNGFLLELSSFWDSLGDVPDILGTNGS